MGKQNRAHAKADTHTNNEEQMGELFKQGTSNIIRRTTQRELQQTSRSHSPRTPASKIPQAQ